MSKKEILKKIFFNMESFIDNKISGKFFSDWYMGFWEKKIRSKNLFDGFSQDILNEMHSDCDCLNYPIESKTDKLISLNEIEFRKIIKKKYKKLKKLNQQK